MKYFLIAVTVATALSFGAARWLTQRPLATLPPLKEALHLTDDQARQVAALDKDYQAKLDDCCQRHCAARSDLGQELGKPELNSIKASGDLDRMCAVQAEIEHATFAHILRVREVLTPAQRERYAQLLNQQVCTACPTGMHQP